jgi:F-box/WD-40 domain protein 8
MELHTHICFFLYQILVYSLEAERCLSKLGNALGDFTCVNLRDSPPNLMVSGNMDRRYV